MSIKKEGDKKAPVSTLIPVPETVLDMLEQRFQEIQAFATQKSLAEQRAREILQTFAVSKGYTKYDFDGKNLIINEQDTEG